jgi:hypothetical protein
VDIQEFAAGHFSELVLAIFEPDCNCFKSREGAEEVSNVGIDHRRGPAQAPVKAMIRRIVTVLGCESRRLFFRRDSETGGFTAD